MIPPRIIQLKEKTLIGLHVAMSLVENRTGELWSQFMPRKNEIKHKVNTDHISLQVYPPDYHKKFSPERAFEKWALVEVAAVAEALQGMEVFHLSGGLYAVFDYKGSSANARIFQYIYKEWLPQSDYELDSRPHFEVLGVNYKNNDPASEEEIWIPIR